MKRISGKCIEQAGGGQGSIEKQDKIVTLTISSAQTCLPTKREMVFDSHHFE